jgi:sugar phosphate isomerase/epimerase
MYTSLNTGAIGIKNYTLPQTIDLARQFGFDAVDFSLQEAADLADQHGIDYVKRLFKDIRPGPCWIPINWRESEAQWKADLEKLPKLGEFAQKIGATRTATWIMPNSGERDFDANFAWHVERFRPIGEALKPYGIRFGLEFIGPQTLRPADKHPFIYTLGGMMELARAIGTGNIGLLVDAWHLYTSGGQVDDLDTITQEDIVCVHVNDAPEGLTMAEYNDHDRRLPLETGVLPLEAFMKKLAAMGYDGPVTVEPFSKRLNALDDPQEAARITADHLNRLWATME